MGYDRNCCIPDCYSNDEPDYIPKVGFLKFPTLKRDDYVLWKKNLTDILNTLSHCPGGAQNFHWVHPGEQNIWWGAPHYQEEKKSGWGAPQEPNARLG